MRIAQINLPVNFNNGAPADVAHEYIRNRLCRVFGGFTSWAGNGAWIDDDGKLYAEPVVVYQVAYDETLPSMPGNIRTIAEHAGRLAEQLAVFYIVDGVAEIVNIS